MNAAPPDHLRGLLVVAGKGGVGKSTVAAALALAQAAQGARTIVVEVAGRGDVARLLGAEPAAPGAPRPLLTGVDHISIERGQAVQEYLRKEAPGPVPAAVLARSRGFDLFVAATPGLAELLTIGKVWDLTAPERRPRGERPYDLVILDAPATGHALALLESPRTFASVARVGPVARQASTIDEALRDPRRTRVVAVCAPEQMAVSETFDLRSALRAGFGSDLLAVIVNGMLPARVAGGDIALLDGVREDPAVRSALWLHGRARSQRRHLARLRRGLRQPPAVAAPRAMTLPFLFAAEIGLPEVRLLARALARRLR